MWTAVKVKVSPTFIAEADGFTSVAVVQNCDTYSDRNIRLGKFVLSAALWRAAF
jgi:hypothetical protein